MGFSVGDKVRIVDVNDWVTDKWLGLEAEVEALGSGSVFLKPLSDRPDGCGRAEFYWQAESLEKVEPVPFPIGSTIRLTESGSESMAAKAGATATVKGYRDRFMDVEWNRDELSGAQNDGGYFPIPGDFELVTEDEPEFVLDRTALAHALEHLAFTLRNVASAEASLAHSYKAEAEAQERVNALLGG